MPLSAEERLRLLRLKAKAKAGRIQQPAAAGDGVRLADEPQKLFGIIPVPREERAMSPAEALEEPVREETRGTVLPVGRTESGRLVPAVPQMLQFLLDPGRAAEGKLDVGPIGAPSQMSPESMGRLAQTALDASPAGALTRRGGLAAVQAITGQKGQSAFKRMVAEAPTAKFVEDQSNTLFKTARESGVSIKPDVFEAMVKRAVKEAEKKGLDPNVTQKAQGAVRRLLQEAQTHRRRPTILVGQKTAGTPVDLEKLDTLRAVIKGSMDEGSAAAGALLSTWNRMIDDLKPSDIVAEGVDPKVATQMLKEARELWHRKIKADAISAAIANGADAASGVSNGIATALRPLLKVDRKTGKPLYKWTPDERKALKAVVDGTNTTNLLRLLGTFGYSLDQARNFLGIVGGGGAAFGLAGGGLPGAAAAATLVGAGTAARATQSRMIQRGAAGAEALALSGGTLPDKIISQRTRALSQVLLKPIRVFLGRSEGLIATEEEAKAEIERRQQAPREELPPERLGLDPTLFPMMPVQ